MSQRCHFKLSWPRQAFLTSHNCELFCRLRRGCLDSGSSVQQGDSGLGFTSGGGAETEKRLVPGSHSIINRVNI